MDTYQIWVDLKAGVRDHEFVTALTRWLDHLKGEQKIESWRLMRKKLGLGPAHLGEFHVVIETRDMAQLDAAFTMASTRSQPVEGEHYGVNSLVTNFQAALYRDFPDPHRVRGEEKF